MTGLWRQIHLAADGIDQRYGAMLRKRTALAKVWIAGLDFIVARQPDRRHLHDTILPAVSRAAPGRVLFVGVRRYSAGHERLFDQTKTEYWSCDIDPAAAPYGAPGRHVTCDVLSLDHHFPRDHFDVVLLNGVFGWGVDTGEAMNRAAAAVRAVLKPGGFLLIGWNTDRCIDPDRLEAVVAGFDPTSAYGLPRRRGFRDVTHVYSWYRKR